MEPTIPSRRRWLRCTAIALTICGGAWVGWWILAPDFIEVNAPVPQHQTGFADIWDEESRSQVRYTSPGSAGCDYVVRRAGAVYPDRHEWKTQADIVSHFDDWMIANGWEKADESFYAEGDPVIPETQFFGKNPPGVRHYVRPGDGRGREGRVALAVWPIRSGEHLLGYNVALASVRPSLLARFWNSLD